MPTDIKIHRDMNTRIREWKCKWKSLRTDGKAGSWWQVGVGCCRKWVGEWDRQVRTTKGGLLGKAIDLTAGFLFAKDKDFNYSAYCMLAYSSEAKVGAQGSLWGTSLPLIPSLFPSVRYYCRHLLFSLPFWNWAPSSWVILHFLLKTHLWASAIFRKCDFNC